MAAPYKIKNYSDCYLYGIGRYDQNVFKYFMASSVINTNDPAFEDIKYNVKRLSPSPSFINTLESPNVMLLYHSNPLPRAFKVFTAKDLKSGDKKLKVFIDMSDLISTKSGKVEIHPANMDKFISLLGTAVMMRIYYSYPDKLFNSSTLMDSATRSFAKLFTYVIDYMRISGVDRMRDKVEYMSSIYFQTCVCGREYSESIERRAKIVSGISAKDVELIDVRLDADAYKNIDTFVKAIAKIINADSLKLDNFIEKWLKLFGSGTQFATEYFPAFSKMLTDTYVGAYMNNQKTIEKIVGRDIVTYSTNLFRIGEDLR